MLGQSRRRALADPRLLRFTAGRRKKFWNKNVVAIGLASGFLEPLESTSIYLIQSGIMRLGTAVPGRDFEPGARRDATTRRAAFEIERIRDFLILHFTPRERDDTPFWDHCRTMAIPEALGRYIDLFRDSGRFFRNADELFAPCQLGAGDARPAHHARRAIIRSWTKSSDIELVKFIEHVKLVISSNVDSMPQHEAFIATSLREREIRLNARPAQIDRLG